ncbi:MAG: HD domain-containing protein [Bacteroidales bacterium]|nr:HD domain-containing protein [Bacteroidales bacterium]MBN2756967.1 HD domain-containing protein [Bacteroidales bacterium]
MQNPLSENIYLKRSIDKNTPIRGSYFRDQTAIIHSMPFRRLKHKTQVFFAPENDHVCTRIEHVLHVATIAKSICIGLNNFEWNLDADMAFAIGLGHDLGHAPFGHEGEYFLNKRLGSANSFIHEINSYRVVEKLTNNGKGLNLTYAVKDGIISHNGESFEQYLSPDAEKKNLDLVINRKIKPSSYEGCIVRFSDKIAYLGRDIEDAITAKFIKRDDIPTEIKENLGSNNSIIIDTLVNDIIDNSKEKQEIGFSDNIFELFKKLKDFNYKYIYNNPSKEENKIIAGKIIYSLFDYLLVLYTRFQNDFRAYENQKLKLDKAFGKYLESMDNFYRNEENHEQIITDYVAGMTDSYALDCMKQISFPTPNF